MRRLVMLAAMAVAALAACGGSSGPKTSVSLAPATGATSSQGTAAPLKAASLPTGGARFCTDAATNHLAQQLQANSAADATQGTAGLQKQLGILKQYESEAPSAIKADVTKLVNWYAKLVQAMTDDQGNPTKLATDLQGMQADEAGITTAIQHVDAYYTANCHGS
jgi:hypothetical protein